MGRFKRMMHSHLCTQTKLTICFVTIFVLGNFAMGQDSHHQNNPEGLLSVSAADEYKLKPDEEWPNEVAHLFANRREGDASKTKSSKNSKTSSKKRNRRWTEWVSEKLEFREDSWDEIGDQKPKPKDPPKFITYKKNGTFVMSRCSSPKGALTLVIACPQPRGSKYHRIVHLHKAFYGWSQHKGEICQYVDGDCTIRYEFIHKQIMLPTRPQNTEEWKSLGPQYFCNPWDGNGREEWEMVTKRWCSVGLRRSSQSPDPMDEAVNLWGKKYLYTWGHCGGSYDWFDYLQIEYTCEDVDESIDPEATRLYHNRPKADCGNGPPPTDPAPTDPSPTNSTNSITEE